MTSWQKLVKYAAMAFAVFLAFSIIVAIIGAVAGLGLLLSADDSAAPGEMQTYAVSDTIHTLDMEIGAAELVIKAGNEFKVESNLEHLRVDDRSGTLTIRENTGLCFGLTYNGSSKITVYIPEDLTFDKVEIEAGAGTVYVEDLSSRELSLDLGAGQVTVDRLTVLRRAEINGGAGEIIIRGGALAWLDLDMGVGECSVTSALSGECDIDCGVGALTLTLLGDKNDYAIQLDKGLGDALIDGKSFNDGHTYGSGSTKIDVDGGVGRIDISFAS